MLLFVMGHVRVGVYVLLWEFELEILFGAACIRFMDRPFEFSSGAVLCIGM